MLCEPRGSFHRGFWIAVHQVLSEARDKTATLDREAFASWADNGATKFEELVWWYRIILRADRPRSELPEYVQEIHAKSEKRIPAAYPTECSAMVKMLAQHSAAPHADLYGRFDGALAAYRLVQSLLREDAKQVFHRFPDTDT